MVQNRATIMHYKVNTVLEPINLNRARINTLTPTGAISVQL